MTATITTGSYSKKKKSGYKIIGYELTKCDFCNSVATMCYVMESERKLKVICKRCLKEQKRRAKRRRKRSH